MSGGMSGGKDGGIDRGIHRWMDKVKANSEKRTKLILWNFLM
jgi:hypothetical protein